MTTHTDDELAADSEQSCYICMESSGVLRKSACVCNASVHYKCLIAYCESAVTTQCSICKSGILDLQPHSIVKLNWTIDTKRFFANLFVLVFTFAMGIFYVFKQAFSSGVVSSWEQIAAMLYLIH